MASYAMLIDASHCTGCGACRIACQMQWQLPPERYYNSLEYREQGKFPMVKQEIVPIQCMHCDNAPCISVCPTRANYKRSDGIVLIDHNKCIGCKTCMIACPYHVRQLNASGVPEKCRFCAEYAAEGGQPPCASTCMNEVRVFGDMEDPNSRIAKLLAQKAVYVLLPEKRTKPRVFYVKQ